MKNHCFPALFVSLFVGMAAQADVVYTNAANSSSFVSISNLLGSRAQTFTNTGPTANIQSVTVYLKNSGSGIGNLFVVIRNITGTPGSSATLSGTAIATSNTVSMTGNYASLSAVTFNFSTPGTALNANTSYAFAVNATGITSGSVDLYYGSPISGQNSIMTVPNSADTTNDLAGQVETVPEPSTLALGGIAAALGGLLCLWKK
jgi:hypothetical protein